MNIEGCHGGFVYFFIYAFKYGCVNFVYATMELILCHLCDCLFHWTVGFLSICWLYFFIFVPVESL